MHVRSYLCFITVVLKLSGHTFIPTLYFKIPTIFATLLLQGTDFLIYIALRYKIFFIPETQNAT
jgi:hypothetical protein